MSEQNIVSQERLQAAKISVKGRGRQVSFYFYGTQPTDSQAIAEFLSNQLQVFSGGNGKSETLAKRRGRPRKQSQPDKEQVAA